MDPGYEGRRESVSGNGSGRPARPGPSPAGSVRPAPAGPAARSVRDDKPNPLQHSTAALVHGALAPGALDARPNGAPWADRGPLVPRPAPPAQPPNRHLQIIPFRRPALSPKQGAKTEDARKARRPQGPRAAARDERQEAAAWRARQADRARSLTARPPDAGGRGATYVMGTANPCKSCGMAVWVAGRTARGRWIKVNLDGSAHICGAPMTGLGLSPPQFLLPAHPMLVPGAAQYVPPGPLGPLMQPVAGEGRIWVERFMVGVALLALLFLATMPREGGNALRGRGPAVVVGAEPASAALPGPAAAGLPAARAEAPRREFFTLASTEDDVLDVMGPPREISDSRWWYGSSYVDFKNGRVVNFYNSIHGELKVKMRGAARTRPMVLSKGLSKDEVLRVQGTPTRLAGSRWYYGSSYVDFREDRVADYFNGVMRELKLSGGSDSQ
jgi:hypothetical protein